MDAIADMDQVRIITDPLRAIQSCQNQLYIAGRQYDYVLLATGFSQATWLTELCDAETLTQITSAVGELSDDGLSRAISHDFSVSGMPAKLHIPMLAGLTQGPGYPNLSCLGNLSDRLLSTYISQARVCQFDWCEGRVVHG